MEPTSLETRRRGDLDRFPDVHEFSKALKPFVSA